MLSTVHEFGLFEHGFEPLLQSAMSPLAVLHLFTSSSLTRSACQLVETLSDSVHRHLVDTQDHISVLSYRSALYAESSVRALLAV